MSRADAPLPGSPHGQGEWEWTPVAEERLPAIRRALSAVAAEHGVSLAQVALNWLMHRRGVASLTIGARTVEQLADNLNGRSWTMSEDERAPHLDDLSRPPELYPAWELRLADDGRMLDPHLAAHD